MQYYAHNLVRVAPLGRRTITNVCRLTLHRIFYNSVYKRKG
jgi:hypothetical protein